MPACQSRLQGQVSAKCLSCRLARHGPPGLMSPRLIRLVHEASSQAAGAGLHPVSHDALLCREKLDALKETGDAAVFRASESTARPEAVELAQQFLELTRKSINSWPQIKPWINGTDSDSLLKQVGMGCVMRTTNQLG